MDCSPPGSSVHGILQARVLDWGATAFSDLHVYYIIPQLTVFLKATIFIYFCFKVLLGEGNGTPLQYSCLENPMDGGAWWAAVYGVANSRT